MRHLFHALVLDGTLRHLIETGDFARLRASDASLVHVMKTLGAGQVENTLSYVKTTIALENFIKVA